MIRVYNISHTVFHDYWIKMTSTVKDFKKRIYKKKYKKGFRVKLENQKLWMPNGQELIDADILN